MELSFFPIKSYMKLNCVENEQVNYFQLNSLSKAKLIAFANRAIDEKHIFCVSMHMWGMYLYICACVFGCRGWHGCLPQSLSICEPWSLLKPSAHWLTRLPGHPAPRSFCLCLSTAGITGTSQSFLCEHQGSAPRSLLLGSKLVSNWAISTTPQNIYVHFHAVCLQMSALESTW